MSRANVPRAVKPEKTTNAATNAGCFVMGEIGTRAEASSGDAFVAVVEHAIASGEVGRISDAELARVMTAAVRLYAAKADVDGETPLPVDPEKLTPTDVVVTVTALIRAVGLNLWDLSMWVQRPRR